MAQQTDIRIRRDTAANWTATSPTLSSGELGYETDTGRIKVGDGATAWTSLAYRFEASGISYSTTETALGINWHDGKAVYRKAFTFTGKVAGVDFLLGTITAGDVPVAVGGWVGDGTTSDWLGAPSGFGLSHRVYLSGASVMMVIGVAGYTQGAVWVDYAR